MRILAFRHVPHEGLGLIEPALAARGIIVDYADLYAAGAALPEIAAYDGLIFLGGPMSANYPLPYLHAELRLIERAVAAQTPLLGVCLGAQLIAKSLGARVYRNHAPEIGWFDIETTQAAKRDLLFRELNPVETVFHWHYDTFDLPAGAELLARSERTERQAFSYGGSIYGLQFHLEVTPQMVVDWCRQDQNCGVAAELDLPLEPQKNRRWMTDLAPLVFGRWCDLLSSAPRSLRAGRP